MENGPGKPGRYFPGVSINAGTQQMWVMLRNSREWPGGEMSLGLIAQEVPGQIRPFPTWTWMLFQEGLCFVIVCVSNPPPPTNTLAMYAQILS